MWSVKLGLLTIDGGMKHSRLNLIFSQQCLCFTDRSYLRITEQKFVSLPIDVSTASNFTVKDLNDGYMIFNLSKYKFEWRIT